MTRTRLVREIRIHRWAWTVCTASLAAGGTVVFAATAPALGAAGSEGRCAERSPSYLGPAALVAGDSGKILYVANADGRQIAVVDVARGEVVRRIGLPGIPTGLTLHGDGSRLIVTCAGPRSTVCVIELPSGRTVAKLAAGHTAISPVVTPDGKRLFVCNRFDNDVTVIDLPGGKEIARVKVTREPIAAAITPDGHSVVVANHLPADAANTFYVASVVTIIDTKTLRPTTIRLPNGSNGLREICISPDGKYAFATHVLSNYELVPSQVVQGWTNTNVLSVINVPGRKLVNTIVLDDIDLGAGNPWGVACTADGKRLCVAHAGTHELSVIDLPAMLEKLLGPSNAGGPFYASATASGITGNPGILTDIRRRIRLPGIGSRGLAIAGQKVFVAQHFSDTVDVVPLYTVRLDAQPDDGVQTIALGPRPKLSTRRRGEMLFHDATICYQHWQSCATCHPDARADGLNWDLRNDGVGNPKNTKSMLLAHRTPPAMVSGVRLSAAAAVRSGIEHILFTDQPEEVAAAIDEYLRSLCPVPSPHLVDGRLSPAAQRGQRVFRQIGCARCHPGPLYTDQLSHDVGSYDLYDSRAEFDTPTLIEAWRTAPYLHNGKYPTLRDLLIKGKHGLRYGRLEKLSGAEIDDLVEYVLSL